MVETNMLALLCSRHDAGARAFAGRHAHRAVHALTCAEVSQSGWRLSVRGHAGHPRVELAGIIGGRRLAGHQITGVITRLRCVTEEELPHIVPEDRAYVAAEMHAFLFAFLAALSCPVVNPPSPACLCGPNLREVQWRELARKLQIPVIDEFAEARPDPMAADQLRDTASEVTIVHEQTLGADEEVLRRWSKQLAQCAGVSYLRVRFSHVHGFPCFVGADPYPCLESEEIDDALLRYFTEKVATC
jgi:hypothetical protein